MGEKGTFKITVSREPPITKAMKKGEVYGWHW